MRRIALAAAAAALMLTAGAAHAEPHPYTCGNGQAVNLGSCGEVLSSPWRWSDELVTGCAGFEQRLCQFAGRTAERERLEAERQAAEAKAKRELAEAHAMFQRMERDWVEKERAAIIRAVRNLRLPGSVQAEENQRVLEEWERLRREREQQRLSDHAAGKPTI